MLITLSTTGNLAEDILESQAGLIPVNAFRRKVIGKTCERKFHARFDEGELKIGQPLWSAVAACRENSKTCSVTTSALYSTVNKAYILCKYK